jgi:uncharacterized membrane protein YedE/YeeE
METILYPLLGGVLIGLSSTIMLAALGRITGISGIISQTLSKPNKEHFWRYAFLGGLLLGGLSLKLYNPSLFHYNLNFNVLEVVLAGLLVGFGTRLGRGCTSGHGVCGMARLAKRSFIATITFILVGMITVFIKGVLL